MLQISADADIKAKTAHCLSVASLSLGTRGCWGPKRW